jgi:hypothetical protein
MKVRLIVPNVEYTGMTENPVARYGPAIAKIAGGFTASQATGGWVDGTGQLIAEPVTVFDCHIDDDRPVFWDYKQIKKSFRLLAKEIACSHEQNLGKNWAI